MSCHYHLFLFLLPDLHYVFHMKPARVNLQITNSSTLNTFGADFGQLSFQEQTTSRQAIMKYITSAVTQVQYGTMVSQFQNVSKHVIFRTYEFNKREPTKGMRTMCILAEAFRRKQQGHKSPGSSRRSYPEWAGSTQWAIGIFKIGPCFVNLSQPNAIGHHGSQSK